MKYNLYHYNAQTNQWNFHCNFDNKDALIRFLAHGTNTRNFKDRHRWTNHYMDNQNLTGKDTLAHRDWVIARDENGECKLGKFGFVYEHVHYHTMREWYLCDADGRTVDMTMFKDEVFDLAEKFSHYPYPALHMYSRVPAQTKKTRQRQGRAYHHSCHFRCSPKNHRYGRTLKTFEEFDEDVETLLTSHQAQAMKVKPKDMYAKYAWGDDFWRRGPSGWKEHKNTRQWEAKQKRTDAVWVSNESKWDIDMDDISCDEEFDIPA
jgi:hypothetical protein